jgi:hypothetical protein
MTVQKFFAFPHPEVERFTCKAKDNVLREVATHLMGALPLLQNDPNAYILGLPDQRRFETDLWTGAGCPPHKVLKVNHHPALVATFTEKYKRSSSVICGHTLDRFGHTPNIPQHFGMDLSRVPAELEKRIPGARVRAAHLDFCGCAANQRGAIQAFSDCLGFPALLAITFSRGHDLGMPATCSPAQQRLLPKEERVPRAEQKAGACLWRAGRVKDFLLTALRAAAPPMFFDFDVKVNGSIEYVNSKKGYPMQTVLYSINQVEAL